MSEWISIEERVPETGKTVLVEEYGEIFLAKWIETKWGNGFLARYCHNCKFEGKCTAGRWMPITEVPHDV